MLHSERNRILKKANFIYKYQNLLFLLLYNFIIAFIIITFCQPIYETSDDFAIGLISTGVYGEEYKQYLIFSNVIWGFFLKLLSNIISINWYIVWQYILVVLSYSVVFYLLSKKSHLGVALFFDMLAWCVIGYEEIRLIQFTRTAAITCIAGLILLVYGIIYSSFKGISVGLLMSLVGSFIRFECFWICLAYIIAFCLAYVVHTGENNLSIVKKLTKWISVIVISVIVCQIFNEVYYSVKEEWKEYREYNAARSYLLDLGIPSWEENQSKYESIGFSQNDVIVLAQWIFNDSNKYTLENMNEIVSWRSDKKIDLFFVRDFLKKMCENLYNSIFLIVWIISFIILLSTQTRGGKVLSVLNFLGTIIIYFYLYYIGRIVARVEFGIWVSAILINFFGYFMFDKRKNVLSVKCSKLSVIIGSILFLCIKITAFNTPPIYESSTRDFLSYLAGNTQNLYVLDVRSFNGACFSFRPYKKVDSFYMSNYSFSGEWGTFSPFSKEYNKRLGFDNPIEDLSKKDNVYYVANQDISYLFTYLQQNYNVASVELVETYNEYSIYKFYTVN